MQPIKSHKDLKVFKLSFTSGMEIYHVTKKFPREEIYALTDQFEDHPDPFQAI